LKKKGFCKKAWPNTAKAAMLAMTAAHIAVIQNFVAVYGLCATITPYY